MPSSRPEQTATGECKLCYNRAHNIQLSKHLGHAPFCSKYKGGRRTLSAVSQGPGTAEQQPSVPPPLEPSSGKQPLVNRKLKCSTGSGSRPPYRQQLLPAGSAGASSSSQPPAVEPGTETPSGPSPTEGPAFADEISDALIDELFEHQAQWNPAAAAPVAAPASPAPTADQAATSGVLATEEEPAPAPPTAASEHAQPSPEGRTSAAAAASTRRSPRPPRPTAFGALMAAAQRRHEAAQAEKKRKRDMMTSVADPSTAGPSTAASTAGTSTVAAPAAASGADAPGSRWECAYCDKAVAVPPSPFDAQVAELLGGGRTLADVLPTYAQLELEALRSAVAATALVRARESLPTVSADMLAVRFSRAQVRVRATNPVRVRVTNQVRVRVRVRVTVTLTLNLTLTLTLSSPSPSP